MKTILAGPGPHDISLYADSAVGRDVQPLFIPDGGEGWRVTLAAAFRVGRLGKSVPPKYAARYIDAVSVVALMHPAGMEVKAGAVPGWLSIMDSAVTTGAWLPVADGAFTATDGAGSHGPCAMALSAATDALALASALATLKTGDVIVPPGPMITLALRPGDIITADIDGSRAIRLKVK